MPPAKKKDATATKAVDAKAPKAKSDASADPDRLIRQSAGEYGTADERFSVEQANGQWFLADRQVADDFGQPRVAGPFATLKEVQAAIPKARSGPTPLRKPLPQPKRPDAAKEKPAPKPETWLDRMSQDDRRRAQRIMKTLEKERFRDAEKVAQHVLEGQTRGLSERLVRARIERLLDEADADEAARRLVTDATRILTRDGGRIGPDLPGWILVETDDDGSPTRDAIELP
jgi:hypothetical protein